MIMSTLLLSGFSLSAQQRVTGTVVDDTGAPLPGANVTVVGTGTGTLTDISGAFSINVPGADASLEVSFVGYLTQTVPVGNRTTIQITLQTDATAIEDVVVIGYGTMQKRQVTSSIQSIGGDELALGVGGATIATALQGKVAGLTMSQSDSPNSNENFQLRGMASINTSRSPLIVIDGMPGGDIRSIAPEEIQSIDVLKDASAGAIYGTRATGGVILITTKAAKAGSASINYTGEVMLRTAFGAPDLLKREDFLKTATGKPDEGADTDWWDAALVKNPISHRHVVTMQGGVEDARILAMIGYDKSVGVLRGDERKDLSGRLNADFKLLDGWVEIGTHLSYRQAQRNQNRPDLRILLRANPTQPVYDPDSPTGWNIYKSGADSNNDDSNAIGDAALKIREGVDKWFRPDISIKVNIKPIRGLSYRQTAAYENRQWEGHEYDPSTVLGELNQGRKGRAHLAFSKTELLNADGYFSYINDFNGHSLNATLGYSYYERNGENFNMTNYDFSNDGVGFWDIGEGSWLNSSTRNPGMSSGKNITERLMAYFARANWSYNDKYMASASIRREGSSKFGANNRWGNFWALSAGWRISNENFMENVSWVNDLKLRVAYGVTGNEGFSASYAARMYGRASERWMMPDGTWAFGYGVTQNINPDLGWEEKREWNVGLDFSLLNDRLYGSFDFYRRGIHGLIYNVDVPQPPNTQDKMYKNIGTMRNLGWELVIGGDIIRGRNWNWSSNMNLSGNTTKIGSLWGNRSTITGWAPHQWFGHLYRLQEGATVGDFHLYRHAGISEGGKMQVYKADGSVIDGSAAGDDDRVYQGNYIPKLMIGWTHSVSYKNLSLDFTLTSWLDYDVMNVFEMFYGMNNSALGNNRTYDAIGKNAAITDNAVASDYFLHDASFIKLQNLTLGYTLPLAKHTNNLVKSVKIYFTGNNLFRITNYPGLNPEVDITGWEGGSERPDDGNNRRGIYPQTRSFTFGAQLSF